MCIVICTYISLDKHVYLSQHVCVERNIEAKLDKARVLRLHPDSEARYKLEYHSN